MNFVEMAFMRMNFVLFGGLKHVLRDLIKISDTSFSISPLPCLLPFPCNFFILDP